MGSEAEETKEARPNPVADIDVERPSLVILTIPRLSFIRLDKQPMTHEEAEGVEQ